MRVDDSPDRTVFALTKTTEGTGCLTASTAVQIGKVFREVGIGYFGEVLLQLRSDFPLSGCIQGLTKIP